MQLSDIEQSWINIDRVAMLRPHQVTQGMVHSYYIRAWVDGVSEVVYLQYASKKQRDDDLAAFTHLYH